MVCSPIRGGGAPNSLPTLAKAAAHDAPVISAPKNAKIKSIQNNRATGTSSVLQGAALLFQHRQALDTQAEQCLNGSLYSNLRSGTRGIRSLADHGQRTGLVPDFIRSNSKAADRAFDVPLDVD